MGARLASYMCCAALALCACGDDDNAPAGAGGGTVTVGGGGRDADSGPRTTPDASDDDNDAGGVALARRECNSVNPGDFADDDIPAESRPSGASLPADFAITREVATWTGDCADPELVIKLSDGRCPDGDGHELTIWIAADATENASLVTGENILVPEPDQHGVRVRYTRPDRLSASDRVGTWGLCAGATGQLVFPDAPDVSGDAPVRGRFLFTLTACDSEPLEPLTPIDVVGAFNLEIERGRADYCPPK